MKCPNDQEEMMEGKVTARPANLEVQWAPKDTNEFAQFLGFGTTDTKSFLCPKCGKIELYLPKKGEEK